MFLVRREKARETEPPIVTRPAYCDIWSEPSAAMATARLAEIMVDALTFA